uniref:Reverse transcriptase zinc-binding domain-containing protein n=1 Tax=Myripristis murdjan TaxID=586833 RepID=A0A668AAB0_9TELE
ISNDRCWRCDKERGTLIHMFYECDVVHSLWGAVIQCINNALKVKLRENPALCILGILQRKIGLSQQLRLWVKLALATGNRVILRHWKSTEKISFKEWRDELTKIASFEQLIYKINNRLDIFMKVWSPFLEMIGN